MIPGGVMETERFKLSCSVLPENTTQIQENLWKLCVWIRNQDGAKCSFKSTEDFMVTKESCDTTITGVEVATSIQLECAISIPSARLSDRGSWTCMLTKCKDKEDGGCSSKSPSECLAESSVNVTVFILFLEAKNINYTEVWR